MIIRAATKNDIDDVLLLLYELGRPKPRTKSQKTMFEKQILQYIKKKQLTVVTVDSNMVGVIDMILMPRLNQTRLEMYVPELVVSRNHQKMGIGKALINHAISVAKKKNCFRIRLESGHARKESHKFYSHLGFDQYAKAFKLDLS
ncbi:GNAT family N-acetyltransferase [Candidatus Nitrosotenuis aquarius]|uniref:GNAT family N-acetyltransferase n=1 Tax=Candidatus Nitrosotenuis aquarius TaxID=1846278 RepID=UPI000C1ED2CE|nr:GNAT family N-acetyltransferase [Candidatus Nitrosotenuis aquarius]